MTIVIVANNKYVEFLTTLLLSIKKNIVCRIEIYVINNGLSIETKKLCKTISFNSHEITFVNFEDLINTFPSEYKKLSPHFWRLFAPKLLKDKPRILYLDVDTIIRKDISQLFLFDMQNKTIAAVVDYLENIETGISNYSSFGMNPQEKYFNSGVLLIDTNRFLELQIAEKIIEITKNNLNFTKACGKWEQYDQYGFNVVLNNDWLELPIAYNYGSELAFFDASIVHFNGHGKPSSITCNLHYKNEFYNYFNEVTTLKNQLF